MSLPITVDDAFYHHSRSFLPNILGPISIIGLDHIQSSFVTDHAFICSLRSSWPATVFLPHHCLYGPALLQEHEDLASQRVVVEEQYKRLVEENRVLAEDFNRERVLRKKYYNQVSTAVSGVPVVTL